MWSHRRYKLTPASLHAIGLYAPVSAHVASPAADSRGAVRALATQAAEGSAGLQQQQLKWGVARAVDEPRRASGDETHLSGPTSPNHRRYGLPDFTGASNIVFTNGLYDPWSGASLHHPPADPTGTRDLVVVNISEGG